MILLQLVHRDGSERPAIKKSEQILTNKMNTIMTTAIIEDQASSPSTENYHRKPTEPPMVCEEEERQGSVELEQELRQILDALDSFQRHVESSDGGNETNDESSLQYELDRLLNSLDAFEHKLERADERDIESLQGLLAKLHDQMNLGGEENASQTSKRSSKRPSRKKSIEKQLELYRHAKARVGWNSYDSPQGSIIKHAVERSKQRQSNGYWWTTIFGLDDIEIPEDPSDQEIGELLVRQREKQKGNKKSGMRHHVLKEKERSHEEQVLREAVAHLEEKINRLKNQHTKEIETYRRVAASLQQENVELRLKMEELERRTGMISS
jgi:hypothetical protein